MNSTTNAARLLLLFLFSLAMTSTAVAQDPAGVEPPVLNKHELLHKYVWSTLGPDGALGTTVSSGLDQVRHSPEEWGTGWSGYGKRWASRYAASAIGNTTKYAVARAFHQDPSFTRCECSGVGPRLRHAVTAPFTARTPDGRRVFSGATLAGFAAEEIIPAATWYPAVHGTRDGVMYVGIDLALKIGSNVFREFVHKSENGRAKEPAN